MTDKAADEESHSTISGSSSDDIGYKRIRFDANEEGVIQVLRHLFPGRSFSAETMNRNALVHFENVRHNVSEENMHGHACTAMDAPLSALGQTRQQRAMRIYGECITLGKRKVSTGTGEGTFRIPKIILTSGLERADETARDYQAEIERQTGVRVPILVVTHAREQAGCACSENNYHIKDQDTVWLDNQRGNVDTFDVDYLKRTGRTMESKGSMRHRMKRTLDIVGMIGRHLATSTGDEDPETDIMLVYHANVAPYMHDVITDDKPVEGYLTRSDKGYLNGERRTYDLEFSNDGTHTFKGISAGYWDENFGDWEAAKNRRHTKGPWTYPGIDTSDLTSRTLINDTKMLADTDINLIRAGTTDTSDSAVDTRIPITMAKETDPNSTNALTPDDSSPSAGPVSLPADVQSLVSNLTREVGPEIMARFAQNTDSSGASKRSAGDEAETTWWMGHTQRPMIASA